MVSYTNLLGTATGVKNVTFTIFVHMDNLKIPCQHGMFAHDNLIMGRNSNYFSAEIVL
jgi:hypothetical protein